MKRQIVLDTETTGLKPEEGHKIVEIGAIELIDGVKTGKVFHQYINPQRNIPDETVRIHGITNEKVKDCPTFPQIVDNFLKFVDSGELLIHNADFDIKFLNYELANAEKQNLWNYVKNATCTVKLSKKLFPEQKKVNLDAMCQFLQIDNSQRTLHGALLDADLLADVYLAITKIHPIEDLEADLEQTNWIRPPIKRFSKTNLKKINLSSQEIKEHENFLNLLEKESKKPSPFRSANNNNTMKL